MHQKSPVIFPLRETALALICALGLANCADSEPGGSADLHDNEQDIPADKFLAKSTSVDKLPVIDAIEATEVFMQQLPKPTSAGENVALHIRLPAPANPELAGSLIRVVGDPQHPLVLFRTDALVELGDITESPGKEFFTAFVRLEPEEIAKRQETESLFSKTELPSQTRIVFEGRTPVAVTTGIAFDLDAFKGGGLVALGACPIQPLSTLARWQESLMITDPAIVRDPKRTNDSCDPGADNPDGVWTFKHLMAEMAIGSGLSTHDFVLSWLKNWLTDVTVNGDVLPARTQMFDQVIRPWATKSGAAATLSSKGVLTIKGMLNLDIAPFRLSAIVNRIDLGATAKGPGGYGGGTTSQPTTAGEMRFIFGPQNLDNCSQLTFSVIFEYGAPFAGCTAVKGWATNWTRLNDPAFAARFSLPWRAHLTKLTESVVVHGAAPTKGNQNAINQVRTNEVALNFPWEFREFTLSKEDPITDIDTPTSGPLRPHTVALTPDDSNYDASSDPRIDDFVLFTPTSAGPGAVLSSVPSAVGSTPGALGPVLTNCSATYEVPHQFNGENFRGGDAFTASPTHWNVAAVNPGNLREVCAREQFSLNTCNGCHFSDTQTSFLQVNPTTMPATLANFLTGGGAGIWSVPDAQFGSSVAVMEFRDLDRRYNRLYEVACAQCGSKLDISPDIIKAIEQIAGVVPIDPIDGGKSPFPVGPITKLELVDEIFNARLELTKPDLAQDVELGKIVRKREIQVH